MAACNFKYNDWVSFGSFSGNTEKGAEVGSYHTVDTKVMAPNGWLSAHLDEFVKPILGRVPRLLKTERFFSPEEMSVIKNMWRSVCHEAERRPILLAGRDVWIFEVLARRAGTPTVFRPDISRLTVAHVREDYSQHFIFDTGFMGTIPKLLRATEYTMASSYGRTIPGQLLFTRANQVFPRLRGARSLALKIEGTPKYWQRGFIQHTTECKAGKHANAYDSYLYRVGGCGCNEIRQDLSPIEVVERAAKLTIEIYTDNSPRFHDGQLAVDKWQLYPLVGWGGD